MRKRTLVLDGVEYTYSPLNIDQLEETTKPLKFPEDADQSAKNEKYRAWVHQVVAHGLNNAQLDKHGDLPNGTQEIDVAHVRKAIDMDTRDQLLKLILRFSKLDVEPEGAPGGDVAAGSSTSPKSAVAS